MTAAHLGRWSSGNLCRNTMGFRMRLVMLEGKRAKEHMRLLEEDEAATNQPIPPAGKAEPDVSNRSDQFADAEPDGLEQEANSERAAPTKARRILVVDDEELVLRSLRR